MKDTSPTSKPAKKAVAKKVPATKSAANPVAKASATAVVKKSRNAKPLFAEVTLEKLTELLGGDLKARVTVSRNFVLGVKEAALKAQAAKELGI